MSADEPYYNPPHDWKLHHVLLALIPSISCTVWVWAHKDASKEFLIERARERVLMALKRTEQEPVVG